MFRSKVLLKECFVQRFRWKNVSFKSFVKRVFRSKVLLKERFVQTTKESQKKSCWILIFFLSMQQNTLNSAMKIHIEILISLQKDHQLNQRNFLTNVVLVNYN